MGKGDADTALAQSTRHTAARRKCLAFSDALLLAVTPRQLHQTM